MRRSQRGKRSQRGGIRSSFMKERREHPSFSSRQIIQILRDHKKHKKYKKHKRVYRNKRAKDDYMMMHGTPKELKKYYEEDGDNLAEARDS